APGGGMVKTKGMRGRLLRAALILGLVAVGCTSTVVDQSNVTVHNKDRGDDPRVLLGLETYVQNKAGLVVEGSLKKYEALTDDQKNIRKSPRNIKKRIGIAPLDIDFRDDKWRMQADETLTEPVEDKGSPFFAGERSDEAKREIAVLPKEDVEF